jgi:hypothetical protein
MGGVYQPADNVRGMRRLALLLLAAAAVGCGGSGGATKPAATATATPDRARAATRLCQQHRAEVAQLVAEAVDESPSPRAAALRAALPVLERSYRRLRALGGEYARLAQRADDSLPILRRSRGRLSDQARRSLRAIARDTRPLAARLGLRACMA